MIKLLKLLLLLLLLNYKVNTFFYNFIINNFDLFYR